MGLPNFSAFIGRKAAQLRAAFNTASGHDHDGVNSKMVTTGAPAAGALAASSVGRAIMADNYFDKATVAKKFAADSMDNAELIQLIRDGAFNADAATRALFDDAIWTLAKLDAGARTHILSYQVEDLGAGADIAARPILEVPAGFAITLISATLIAQGDSAGIDDANTAVIKLTDGTNDIVAATYKTGALPPASGASASLGEPAADHKALVAGEKLRLDVAQGATANLPMFMIQVVYSIAAA
jgi:hypothetical protein